MRTVARMLAAGAGAGLGFGLFSTACYGTGGRGFWRPVNLVAHTVWRGAPVDDRFSVAATVLAVPLLAVVGAVLFLPYLALAVGAGLSPVLLVPGAAVYANVVWIFGDYLLWPRLDPVAATRFSPGVAWVGHAVAGVVAGALMVWPWPWPRARVLVGRTGSRMATTIRMGR